MSRARRGLLGGKVYEVTLTPSSTSVTPAAGNTSFTIKVNGSTSFDTSLLSISKSDNLSSYSQTNSYTIKANYPSNTSTSSTKSYYVYITYNGIQKTFTITQAKDYVTSTSTSPDYSRPGLKLRFYQKGVTWGNSSHTAYKVYINTGYTGSCIDHKVYASGNTEDVATSTSTSRTAFGIDLVNPVSDGTYSGDKTATRGRYTVSFHYEFTYDSSLSGHDKITSMSITDFKSTYS